MIRKLISLLLNIKGDFQNLFIFNEYEELTGKSRGKIIALSVILGLTFLALGYAIGGINYLKEKMDDPFTNWVNLQIKNSYRDKVANIKEDLMVDSLKNKFSLNNIGQYNTERFRFISKESGESLNQKVRTIDYSSELLKVILSTGKGNVSRGYSYDGEGEIDIPQCGIIIKESTLKNNLGYEDISGVLRVPMIIDSFILYPEIISVVDELPNLADVLISPHFYMLLREAFETTNFINTSTTNQMHLMTEGVSESELDAEIRSVISKYSVESTGFEEFEIKTGEKKTITSVYFTPFYSFNKIDTIYRDLKQNSSLPFEKYTKWECSVGTIYNIKSPYYLSFNFDKLDFVQDFEGHMANNYEVEISMDQVEQKENFALVSKLTNFISLILFGFSILSIVFYVNSLLRTHLEKIKTNLGTLKAFGLNNKFLISSYMKIIFSFMSISIIIAYIICGIWDIIEGYLFENSYFDVFNYKIFIAIIIVIITALLTSQRTISKTLLKTPGDLIYNR